MTTQINGFQMTSHTAKLSSILLALAGSAAFASTDIESISEAGTLIYENHTTKSSAATASYEKALVGLVLDQARSLAKREGILVAGQIDTDDFRDSVRDLVKPMVKQAAEKSSAQDRKSALYKALREVSTQRFSEDAISAWLHLAPTSFKSTGLGPRANTQVGLRSSDGRLKLFLDEEARVADVGGPGTGNGVVDAGEWVNFKFGIYNDSADPFVSSSAWITVDDTCAWTPRDEEIELPEFSAVDPEADKAEKPAGMAEVDSWVYISTACAHNSQVPLSIRIQDTHNTKQSPIILTANVRVTNRGRSNVLNYLVDSDIPGSSQGADLKEIVPELRLEFSHDLSTGPGEVTGAQMAWSMADELRPLLVSGNYRAEEPMVLKGSTLGFGDDLDIETHATKALHSAIDVVGKAWGWDSVEDARFWLKTDTVVQYVSLDPPAEEEAEKLVEVCDNYLDDDLDGKHDCEDSDCSEADACQPAAKALAIGQVFSLVQQHAEIVASPAKANLDDAISAVDPNYELLLDRAAFGTEYGCLVNRLPVSKCGSEDTHIRCTDTLDNDSDGKLDCEDSDCKAICELIAEVSKKEEEAKEKEPEPVSSDTGRNESVAYAYRHFFTLPIQPPPEGSPESCFDEWDNDLDGDADCDDSDCSALCEQHENDHAEYGENSCRNGTDDDLDRKIDCDDPDCSDDPYCHDEVDYAFHGELSCQDGVDNDLRDDGVDCSDTDGCRASPECARPTAWRVDVGVDVNPMTVADAPAEGIVWDRGPTLSGLFVRPAFSWGGRGESRTPMSVFASLSLFPELPVINNRSGALRAQNMGLGFAFEKQLTDWLSLEPNIMVGQRSLQVGFSQAQIPSKESAGVVVQPGASLRMMGINAGPVLLSAFVDLSLSMPSELLSNAGGILVNTGFFSGRAGVGIHF